MAGLLISNACHERIKDRLAAIEREHDLDVEHIVLPLDPDARLSPETLERVTFAFFSSDIFPLHSRQFFAAAQGAPNLRWLHVLAAGTDHPIFQGMLQRGVRITNSAGASAVPIAQTLTTGLLMLARGFPSWLDSQRRMAWEPLPDSAVPADLATQTLVVVGVGAIGREICRLGQALGLRVIGVRRSPMTESDPVDEMHHPDKLHELLPRADWLAIAAPLTDQTRGLISAEALDLLPPGAAVLNVGRGPIIDEPALVARLQSGALSGAYLDVFEEEPLPESSELWGLSNVIITPHNSAASRGNAHRVSEIFLENYRRWAANEPFVNEV